MKKNKLFLIIMILATVVLFSSAAMFNQCRFLSESEVGEEKTIEDEEEEIKEPTEESAEEGVSSDTKRARTPPTIELEIYEGPTYVEADDVCYYRIAAIITGDPAPEVEFSKDDSEGSLGEGKTQVNLYDTSDTYTLTATATNPVGNDTASIDLSWGCILEFEAAERLDEVMDEGVIGDIPYVTLHPSDIGYVIGGDGVNTESLIIGDSIQNKGVMGYFAFDLNPLADKKVASATLRIKTYRLYDNLWGPIWGRIALGLRDYLPLDASDYFQPKPNSDYLYETVFTDDPDFTIVYSSADLKKIVQDSINSGKKLQFYLASMVVGDSDNDNETDGREFTKETISLIIDLSD